MSGLRITTWPVTIPRLDRRFDGYRILQITDVHLGQGRADKILLQQLPGLRYDLLALTGDIVHRPRHIHLIRPFLERLGQAVSPPDGIVAVWGNHDSKAPDEIVAGLPIRWLNNEAMQLRRGSAMLNLIGINQKHRNLSDLIGPLLRIEPGSPVILLAHYPSTVYWFNGAIDLVIAGHTHGGQVRLPGLPHMTNDDFSWRHAAGLHRIGQTQLVVSRGMGRSGLLPFRVFAPAELTVVELKSTVSPEAAD